MLSSICGDNRERQAKSDRLVIVTQIKMDFDGKESQLLTFNDMTVYKRLQVEENKNRQLKSLNASMQHEILTPLKINLQVAEGLSELKDLQKVREMAQVISASCKIMLFHANNSLDHLLIQNGNFKPDLEYCSVSDAILEVVELVRWTIKSKDLDI